MKTLPEQQAEAWRLAPDDAEAIRQTNTGDWWQSRKDGVCISFICPGERPKNWRWSDTLQSREEWEAMNNENTFTTGGMYKPKNTEWKDGLPPVGAECEICNCEQGFEWCVVRYMGPKLCVVDHKTHDDQHYHLGSVKFRPIKSEADKLLDEHIEKIKNILVLESSMGNPSLKAAERLYDSGCRMTRELTDSVVTKIIYDAGLDIESRKLKHLVKSAAAYVKGEDYD